nr:alcohol dehydrogenase (EC 1.1.1.1) - Baltic cod (fragments) [Gadus morhua callarias]
ATVGKCIRTVLSLE